MKNNIIVNDQKPLTEQEVLQLTALLYFSEALEKQEYENCKELIDIAKDLGAAQSEISEVISNVLYGRKAQGPGEAKIGKNRLGLL